MLVNGDMIVEVGTLFEYIPPFFAAASQHPSVLEHFWQQVLAEAIHNPLAEDFKGGLFAYYSWHEDIPYCTGYHIHQLLHLGWSSSEIETLVDNASISRDKSIEGSIKCLIERQEPLNELPAPNSEIGQALLNCGVTLYARPHLAERCRVALRACLSPDQYATLIEFLDFIRTCQHWIEAYPEEAREADIQIQEHLRDSYQQDVELAQLLMRRGQLQELGPYSSKQKLKELESYTRHMATIFEVVADSVTVYTQSGKIIYANSAARDLYGTVDAPEIVRLQMSERAEHFDLRDEHGQRLTEEAWPARQILSGKIIKGSEAVDVIVRGASGSDSIVSFSGAPIRLADGHQIGAVVLGRDVTARRQLERQTHDTLNALLRMAEELVQNVNDDPLGQSEGWRVNPAAQRLAELARSILGTGRITIMRLDTTKEHLLPAAVIGMTSEQETLWRALLTEYKVSEYMPDATVLQRLGMGRSVNLNVEGPTYSFLRDRLENQKLRSLLMTPMRIRDQLIGWMVIASDGEQAYTEDEIALTEAVAKLGALVLERERLLEERAEARANVLALREAKRRTDEFLSLASHELRAPLTIIKANAQLIKRHMRKIGTFSQELGSESGVNGQMLRRLESIPEMLDRSIMQVDLLDRLVGDLLDFSRIQTETLSLFLNLSDLTEIVRNVVEGQREVYQERDIRLRLPDEEKLMIVNADVGRIGQVLTNYLINAFKYSEPDAPVEIEVRVDGEQARVLVRDQGVGLPPEALSRIWERFYREPGIVSVSGPSTSLGLGLHICQTIMHLHHGEVGVESVRGQGSTFWFALPLMQIGHEEGERA